MTDPDVRVATSADAASIGGLLHDFNTEFDELTPGPARLAARMLELIDQGPTVALLVSSGPEGQ